MNFCLQILDEWIERSSYGFCISSNISKLWMSKHADRTNRANEITGQFGNSKRERGRKKRDPGIV
jgi:hypothetical protein